jgi:hypothetical protein
VTVARLPTEEDGLDISFESKQLRTICENEAEGILRLGGTVAQALRDRLADIESASSPKELLAGRPREQDEGTLCVDLDEGYSMLFVPNHAVIPVTDEGKVDWGKVHRVRIIKIENGNPIV